MSLIRIQPDKEYSVVEERLRFPVPADLNSGQVPFYIARDLTKSIEILERHRDWHFMDRVPQRIKFCGKPCCSEIALGLPGQPLPIRFAISDYQGDTDDAHNFAEMSDPNKRTYEDNIVDWVAICHFWQPVVVVEMEPIFGEKEGFVSPENMPDMKVSQKHAQLLKLAANGAAEVRTQ